MNELHLHVPFFDELWYRKQLMEDLNIPSRGYRESGKMETAVPAKWKPVLSPL